METTDTKQQFNFQIPLDLKRLLDDAASKKSTTMTQYLIDLLVADLKGFKQKEIADLDEIIDRAKSVLKEEMADIKNSLLKEEQPMSWNYRGLQNNPDFFGTQKDWNQTLIASINKMAANLAKVTPNSITNKLVIHSGTMFAIMQDLEYFKLDTHWRMCLDGPMEIGVLGSRYGVHFQALMIKSHAISFFHDNEYLGELTVDNAGFYHNENNEYEWDYSGIKNNKDFFGTQNDWNHTLVEFISNVAYEKYNKACHLEIEVFSPLVFDMLLNSGLLEDVRIDRQTNRSSATVKGRLMSIVCDKLDASKENVIHVSEQKLSSYAITDLMEKKCKNKKCCNNIPTNRLYCSSQCRHAQFDNVENLNSSADTNEHDFITIKVKNM